MSKESTPELTKSWVFVDQEGPVNGDAPNTSGVQEVAEAESHVDSDTDSISVISESGCSYKTDEEEYTAIEEVINNELETIKEDEPPELETPTQLPTDIGADIVFYFTTSLVCALALLCFSCAIQRYLQGDSNANKFDHEQEVIFSQLKNQETVLKEEPSTKFTFKKIKHIKTEQIPKIAKLEEENLSDTSAGYKYKMKQKNFPRCERENCEKRGKYHDDKRPDDINEKNEKTDDEYDKKIKELRIKEDYLKEKEKFLIEREHALLKKEMKLNKEKQHTKNKHDKKSYKREKEEEIEEPKTNDNKNSKSQNKKRKYDDKKKFTAEKRKFFNEQDKKRNISGQWYINLHEARDNMRQKKYAYFKRNKAHWYFQWMVDRARLRGK